MNPILRTIIVAIGFLLHAMAGWIYLVSGLVVPVAFLLILWTLWLGLLAWAIWQRHHPWRVLATPFIAAAIWAAFVPGLGSLLGWTA